MSTATAIVERVASELNLKPARVSAVSELFEDGATVPFVARYRKERTGEMDETVLRAVQQALQRERELAARRESMVESLRERELLTGELEKAIRDAETMAELEDVYLPFRPKRVTRASKARDCGLEPLADAIQRNEKIDPFAEAERYIDPERGVETREDALSGARDILAERISEERESRGALRRLFEKRSILESKRSRREKGDERADTYQDYFAWSEPAGRAPSHRVLAMLRGEREGFLVVHVSPPEHDALDLLRRRWVSGRSPRSVQLEQAVVDAYRRLILPSLETEQKHALFVAASEAAAQVFRANLRDLLLAAPLGPRRILAIDPGFRTGCKVVCLDEHGKLEHHEAIYPLEPHNKRAASSERIVQLVRDYGIEAIAVGNGTGGRETVGFLATITGELPEVVSVNEAGASVYSASEVARAELPDQDVTVRGAVSIGRRLMDPLSELVKIEPRSIGVGQYQHDVDPRLLEQRLTETVESCVNLVGADLNTASPHLLQYIAGISERVARAIVAFRDSGGGFTRRKELMDVRGVGARTYEQAAGFLRVNDGDEPLDATAVHPERYGLVRRMARDAGCAVEALIGNAERVDAIDLESYVGPDVGLPTLRDIAEELKRPGRDPRPPFATTSFDENVHAIDDLTAGMTLPGVVTNVTDFGAFVDIGVHRDGLVHISKLARGFVRDPHEVVRVGQGVEVTVVEVDTARNRISLSMVD